MKRFAALTGTVALLMAFGPALAGGHEDGPPPHGHMLVLGLQFDSAHNVIGFRKCVDLANGRALKNNAHHDNVHEGRAGQALQTRAGHGVAPTDPLTPFSTCADLEDAFSES